MQMDLLLAIAAFTVFYLLIEHSQRKNIDPWALNAITFASGVLLSIVALWPPNQAGIPGNVLWIGAAIGLAASLGMLGIILAIRSGIAVSIVNTTVSLSLALPILLSVVFLHESISPQEATGLTFAAGSIYLLRKDASGK